MIPNKPPQRDPKKWKHEAVTKHLQVKDICKSDSQLPPTDWFITIQKVTLTAGTVFCASFTDSILEPICAISILITVDSDTVHLCVIWALVERTHTGAFDAACVYTTERSEIWTGTTDLIRLKHITGSWTAQQNNRQQENENSHLDLWKLSTLFVFCFLNSQQLHIRQTYIPNYI